MPNSRQRASASSHSTPGTAALATEPSTEAHTQGVTALARQAQGIRGHQARRTLARAHATLLPRQRPRAPLSESKRAHRACSSTRPFRELHTETRLHDVVTRSCGSSNRRRCSGRHLVAEIQVDERHAAFCARSGGKRE
jgi:hypothetical protein